MKTALCLYGQPREFASIWSRFYNNIVVPNDADVFFHSWYDANDLHLQKIYTPGHEHRTLYPNLDQLMLSVPNLRAHCLEAQRSFHVKEWNFTDENIDACWPYYRQYPGKLEHALKQRVFIWASMAYSMHKTLMLKEEYAHSNDIEYDCVILARYDVAPTKPLNSASFDLAKFYTHEPRPRGELSDWFMFSNNGNMNAVMTTLFYMIDYHCQNLQRAGDIMTFEAFIREQVRMLDIPVEIADLGVRF